MKELNEIFYRGVDSIRIIHACVFSLPWQIYVAG